MRISMCIALTAWSVTCQPQDSAMTPRMDEQQQEATVMIDVSSYATAGDGSRVAPWIGWDAATPWSDGRTFRFPAGVYRHSNTFVIRSRNTAFRGEAGTVLEHLGSGDAVRLDGTSSGPGYMYNVVFENFVIRGNANTANGLLVHNVSHVVLRNLRVTGSTESAYRAMYVIAGVFDNLVVSSNEEPLSPQPKYGITLSCDWNNCANRSTNAVTILNPIVEGVSEIGILLQEAEYNTIIGGTSEANALGIYIGANGRRNKIVNTDLEANGAFPNGPCHALLPTDTLRCRDAMIWGDHNVLDNIQSTSGVMINGDDNLLIGGNYTNIRIRAAADRTRLRDLQYGTTCSVSPTSCGDFRDESGTGSTEWSGLSHFWAGHPQFSMQTRYPRWGRSSPP
jgi:Periplasmic copper-binding protein (NosD)